MGGTILCFEAGMEKGGVGQLPKNTNACTDKKLRKTNITKQNLKKLLQDKIGLPTPLPPHARSLKKGPLFKS